MRRCLCSAATAAAQSWPLSAASAAARRRGREPGSPSCSGHEGTAAAQPPASPQHASARQHKSARTLLAEHGSCVTRRRMRHQGRGSWPAASTHRHLARGTRPSRDALTKASTAPRRTLTRDSARAAAPLPLPYRGGATDSLRSSTQHLRHPLTLHPQALQAACCRSSKSSSWAVERCVREVLRAGRRSSVLCNGAMGGQQRHARSAPKQLHEHSATVPAPL
jgi:hypothetical protein